MPLKIHAAKGKVEIQAKNNKMQIDAKKDLELTSSTAKVMIVGKDEVMISGGGGSYIKLKNGEIILASPKIVRVKAPAMPVGGSDSFVFNGFAKTDKTCIPCKIAELIGRPVNPISGIKVLPDETDFAFDGLVPFVWSRSYFSDLKESWLGSGWRTTLSAKLERKDGRFTYTDNQGRTLICQNWRKMKDRFCLKQNKSSSNESIMAAIKLAVWMGIVDRDSLRYI